MVASTESVPGCIKSLDRDPLRQLPVEATIVRPPYLPPRLPVVNRHLGFIYFARVSLIYDNALRVTLARSYLTRATIVFTRLLIAHAFVI